MNKKRFLKFLALSVILQLAVSGCGTTQFETLRKKFIRVKKTKEKPTQFLAEPVKRPSGELYQEHFLYFKTWNETLVRNLGGNRKRELEALRETHRHLISLPKYLEDEYADGLFARIMEFEKSTADLEKRSLPQTQNSNLARRLKRLGVQIENKHAFKDIKDHMKKDASRIDLSAYPEDDLGDVFLYEKNKNVDHDQQAVRQNSDAQTQSATAQPAN